jgi:uncharacterized membrane protein HdeD (DUF308 family)
MVLVARGALHLVTTTFEGIVGALSALQGAGEFAAGALLLLWPRPTTHVVVVVVGALVLVEAIVNATIILATRAGHWRRRSGLAVDGILGLLAAALLAQSNGTVHGVAITLGILMFVAGTADVARSLVGEREPAVREAEAIFVR